MGELRQEGRQPTGVGGTPEVVMVVGGDQALRYSVLSRISLATVRRVTPTDSCSV
jgi:hypothetical protein